MRLSLLTAASITWVAATPGMTAPWEPILNRRSVALDYATAWSTYKTSTVDTASFSR